MTSPAVVYIVDDDPSVRRSLARILRVEGYAVETLASAEEFLQQKTVMQGCVLLDLRMPGLNGLELQEALTREKRPVSIVFITGHGEVPESVQAMKAGAVDFLPKPVDDHDLLNAVERALAKNRLQTKEHQDQRKAQTRVSRLTPREREVLTGVLAGRLNKQIAHKLGISEKTVKVHRGRVMEKMRVGSVADLVRLAEKMPLS